MKSVGSSRIIRKSAEVSQATAFSLDAVDNNDFLEKAVSLSGFIAGDGGFPVGAIIVMDGKIIAQGVSDGKRHNDPTWHAETDAIRKACDLLKTRNLEVATLYSSMEPCMMCYGACYWARLGRVVYAASKDKLASMHYEKGSETIGLIDMISKYWPTEIVHGDKYEERALKIISDWENKL